MAGEHGEGDRAAIRRQIERLLDSPEFAASQRLSAFLEFVCEAALEGRAEIGQAEIARAVLGRGEEFNPLEDSSVRRMATLARQRLEQYYTKQGRDDPVLLILPARSYVPRFRFRDGVQRTDPDPGAEGRPWLTRARLAAGVGAVLVVFLAVLGVLSWRRTGPGAPVAGQWVVTAGKGAITFGRRDAPPDSILLGPNVEATDVAIARMTFTPRREAEQAGIMVFVDADNYVKLGRILLRRTQIELAGETRGVYVRNLPTAFAYDPAGQTGEPVWLAIRRKGAEFSGFTSHDGRAWRRTGEKLRLSLPGASARLAIYAFTEYQEAQPPQATFEHVSVGPAVADWDGERGPLPALDGWKERNACGGEATTRRQPLGLEVTFAEGTERCDWTLSRAVPACEWSLAAVVESPWWARTYAGLQVAGTKDTVQITRMGSEGGSIVGYMSHGHLFRRPDLPGSPPLTMRIRCSGGILGAEVSGGFDRFEALPLRVRSEALGSDLMAGIRAGRRAPAGDAVPAPIVFHGFALEPLGWQKYR